MFFINLLSITENIGVMFDLVIVKVISRVLRSIHNKKCYPILFYHLKKLLYQLYHTILQHIQRPNFYFPILLIKIIYLHNKFLFLFSFFSIFSSTCVCIFLTPPFFGFSPSSPFPSIFHLHIYPIKHTQQTYPTNPLNIPNKLIKIPNKPNKSSAWFNVANPLKYPTNPVKS